MVAGRPLDMGSFITVARQAVLSNQQYMHGV